MIALLEDRREQLADLCRRYRVRHPVDLVMPRAITNPYFRQAVEQTREVVYAA